MRLYSEKDNYSSMTALEIAKHIGHSKSGVRWKIRKLQLTKAPRDD